LQEMDILANMRKRAASVTPTTRIRDGLLEQFAIGSQVSQREGFWRMGIAILSVVLESGDLGPEASRLVQRVLAAITAAPLSPEDEELFSDEFFDFRERKNGRAWVLKDAEDGAVLACIGAFEKCREPDETPFEVAVDVEELLTGKVGPSHQLHRKRS